MTLYPRAARTALRCRLAAPFALLSACGLSACAGTRVDETVTVTSPAATSPDTQAAAPVKKRRRPRAVPTFRSCSPNLTVKRATTSCPFAENVFYSYWLNEQQPGVFDESPGLPAYSPIVGKMFYVDCSGTNTIVCRAGDGGYVRFPATAVLAYTELDAATYAATAELGDVPPFTIEPQEIPFPDPPPDASDGGGCDPSYEGACLDPSAGDYDCAGGRGDGPKYTGPVTVVGDDHFGLDRDGDGRACE